MLYHYTCHHGRVALGNRGVAYPLDIWNPRVARIVRRGKYPMMAALVWFTDLDIPIPFALGLTRHTLTCDRTEFRYRVINADDIVPWLSPPMKPARRSLIRLEREVGALPRHWFVAATGVPVRFDP